MIEDGLSGEEDVACLEFNGWAFQGFDDAKTVLIEAIIGELGATSSRPLKRAVLSPSLL